MATYLESRNAAAMASAQAAYDNAAPADDIDLPQWCYDAAFDDLLQEYAEDDITDVMVGERALEIARGEV